MRAPCPTACTIVSNNYLAAATVLARSYRRHHPGARVFVCVVDRPAPGLHQHELPFDVVYADQLGIPAFENMAFRYDVLELNTAVKPFLLAYLRDREGLDRALYFDPDIWVLDRLDELHQDLDRASMVLTPHITEPLNDAFHPTEATLRQCGIYNLGFLGIRLDDATRAFLEWWQDRLLRFCVADLANGLFVDQSWMDFAPAFIDRVAINRSEVFNVAYWNLGQRPVERNGGSWRINGRPIGFAHFSGFDPHSSQTLSRHQDRLTFREHPELRELFEGYRSALLAEGHDRWRLAPYGYRHFSGTPIPVPRLARQLLHRIDPLAKRWRDPFSLVSSDCYLRWLVEPIERRHGTLNRLTLSLWEERADLSAAFPDVLGADLPRYVRWLREKGTAEGGLDPFFCRALRERPAKRRDREAFGYASHPYDAAVVDHARELLQEIDLAQPEELLDWLDDPVKGAARSRPVLTRLALLIYRSRPGVQAVYPDPLGRDQSAFAYWFVRCAAEEYDLDPRLVRTVARSLTVRQRCGIALWRWRRRRAQGRRSADPWRPAPPALPPIEPADPPLALHSSERSGKAPERVSGVNVVGGLEALSGVGEAARGTLHALRHAEIPTAPFSIHGRLEGKLLRGRIHPPSGLPFPITLLHSNADATPGTLSVLPRATVAGTYLVGCWFWELAHFPLQLADRFSLLDEIWAPSRFCQSAFAACSPLPVRYVPPCVPETPLAAASRERFGLERDRFYFLFSFDLRSVTERKNPSGLLEAFRLLQRHTRRKVGLVLKVVGAENAPELLGSLHRQAEGLPVVLTSRDLEATAMRQLVASCDAVVSLHRSEGLGLLMVEALMLEKPVVATGYGGVTDFLDEETGFPVPHELVALERPAGPYPAGAVWAEPSIEAAAELMARVVEDVPEAQRRTRAGQHRVRSIYGTGPAAARLRCELERILDLLGARPPAESEMRAPKASRLSADDHDQPASPGRSATSETVSRAG